MVYYGMIIVLTTTGDSGVITQGRPTPTLGVREHIQILSVRNLI